MKTLPILLKKEFLQFRRNKLMPRLALLFPCMVILIIPLVATMDVQHVGVAIVDHDNSTLSHRISTSLDASALFSVTTAPTYADAMAMIENDRADVVLTLPRHLERNLLSGQPVAPDIAANGVNGIKGSIGSAYVMQAVGESLISATGRHVDSPSIVYRFNPTLDYRHFMIPALMTMLLIMLCGFMPALNMASEKETGTIEQINVTAVNPFTFILSKLIPYWIIGLVVISIGMAIGVAVYGLVPAGSLTAIYTASALFILVMSGIGILIANFSSTMTSSMFLMLFIVLIFILMSGLLTPIDSMPEWAQNITLAVPPRYFINIMRSVYLKATSINALIPDYAALALCALTSCTLAAITYSKRN
ncbi:MAG: ABC transporter permease [Muribaculaceae bacterium]|nr:ABC transporter permease [Muribaculaceae bacterium]